MNKNHIIKENYIIWLGVSKKGLHKLNLHLHIYFNSLNIID